MVRQRRSRELSRFQIYAGFTARTVLLDAGIVLYSSYNPKHKDMPILKPAPTLEDLQEYVEELERERGFTGLKRRSARKRK